MYDDIFVNEDISKPENRINLALFHLQMNNQFHNWFFQKLNLSGDCVLYPVKNVEGTRPDYVIKNSNGSIIGYVEVECGVDLEQFERFKSTHEKDGVTVYAIFGLRKYNPDISLEEIKRYIESNYDSFHDAQEKISSKYLVELINNTIYTIKDTKRRPVDVEFVKSTPFLVDLLNGLADIETSEFNRPYPGKLYFDTNKPKGFSIQVYSYKGVRKSISLLNISGGRPYINFQSEAKYRDYLAHKPKEQIDEWIDYIKKELRFPIDLIKYNGQQSVPITTVHSKIEGLIELIKALI